MINEGVFDSDWNLIEENVDKFIRKYDENISTEPFGLAFLKVLWGQLIWV